MRTTPWGQIMGNPLRIALFTAACTFSFQLAAAPPPAPTEPVTDDYYGTKLVDPYRWMESGKDPRWTPWLKAHAAHSRSTFDSMAGRARLLSDISQRTGALPAVARVVAAGEVMIWQDRPAGAQDFLPVIDVVEKGIQRLHALLDALGQPPPFRT